MRFKPWVYTDVPKYLLLGGAIALIYVIITKLLI